PRQQLGFAMHLQSLRRRRGQREATVFVKDDEASIGVKKTCASQTAITPRDLAGLDIDGGEGRRTEITARPEDQLTDANAVAEMHAHQAMRPNLLARRFVAAAREFERAAAAAVSGRDEEQIVFAPHRRAGVEAEIGRMRMAP